MALQKMLFQTRLVSSNPLISRMPSITILNNQPKNADSNENE